MAVLKCSLTVVAELPSANLVCLDRNNQSGERPCQDDQNLKRCCQIWPDLGWALPHKQIIRADHLGYVVSPQSQEIEWLYLVCCKSSSNCLVFNIASYLGEDHSCSVGRHPLSTVSEIFHSSIVGSSICLYSHTLTWTSRFNIWLVAKSLL